MWESSFEGSGDADIESDGVSIGGDQNKMSINSPNRTPRLFLKK